MDDWGRPPGPGDVFWSLANEKVGEVGATRSWHELKQLYWGMAQHLSEEGHDPKKLQVQSHRMELQAIAEKVDTSRLIKAVKILAHACCDECNRLDRKTLTLKEANDLALLPAQGCTRGWCNCSYSMSASITASVNPQAVAQIHLQEPLPITAATSRVRRGDTRTDATTHSFLATTKNAKPAVRDDVVGLVQATVVAERRFVDCFFPVAA